MVRARSRVLIPAAAKEEVTRDPMEAKIRREMVELLPRLRRFARGLAGSADAGDELLQATCERALSNLEKWRPDTRLDSWMYRIARNLYLNELRSRKVRQQHLRLAAEQEPLSHDGARSAEARMELAATGDFLKGLPEEQRSVLLLVCVEGLSYEETSAVLEAPVGTVTSRLSRARQALRDWQSGLE
jgi:RNA polymerase sigma-70 factor (ECF subfamily)